MVFDLVDSGSLLTVVAEDFEDKVFEIVGQVLAPDFLPIVIDLACDKQIVEVFVLFGLFEREDALNNDE